MDNPEISIIVPIYNVEKYLDKCIKSIQIQTFSDIEIILVDDGSTDKSGSICDSYAAVDKRIHVIHKENSGVSAARNTGIRSARGKYIGFIDGDDYIAPDMYETLRDMLVRENAEIAVCGMRECFSSTIQKSGFSVDKISSYCVLDSYEAIRLTLEGLPVLVSTKLYKSELFSDFMFPVGKAAAEDAYVTIHLLGRVNKVAVTEAEKYYYVRREGSVTMQAYDSKILSTIELWKEIYDFVREKYPELLLQAEHMYLWSYFYVLDRMIVAEKVDEKVKKEIIREIRASFKRILRNPYFGKMRKLETICLVLSENLYRLCTRIYLKKRTGNKA